MLAALLLNLPVGQTSPKPPPVFTGPVRYGPARFWEEDEPVQDTKGPEPAEIHFAKLRPLPDYSADRERVEKVIKVIRDAEEDELMQVFLLLED